MTQTPPESSPTPALSEQATAIVAARFKIVEGAVGMVELALEMLSKKGIVDLDEEKKAAMVSNLMVVLCGERGAYISTTEGGDIGVPATLQATIAARIDRLELLSRMTLHFLRRPCVP